MALRWLGVLLLAACLLTPEARARHRHAHSAGGFDYFLLSLSVAPSFCALSPANQAKTECRTLTEAAYHAAPFTVHGLWPNRIGVGADRQPQDCPAAPLALPADLQVQLQQRMPGGAGLERHEWSRHGSCSGLSASDYFTALVRLDDAANATIGQIVRDRGWFGRQVPVADLLAAVAGRDPAMAGAIVVSCRLVRAPDRMIPLVEEVRMTLSRQLTPIAATSVGMRQSIGCPSGAGFMPG